MKKLKQNEYQCEMCLNVYEKDWGDEEAAKEAIDNFGAEIMSSKGLGEFANTVD